MSKFMNHHLKELPVACFLLFLLLLLGVGCSEDKLSEDQKPEITRVMEGVRFEYPKAYIPEGLNAAFKIYGLYNDLTEEVLTTEELNGNTTWTIETNENITIKQDISSQNKLRFSGIGSVRLTVNFQNNENTFQSSSNFRITVPVIASIAVKEVLESPDLINCCQAIRDDVSGKIVKGCVRRFKAIGTYDNGFVEDQSSDALDWSTNSNSGLMVEQADLSGYPKIASCLLSNPEISGIVFANAIGNFSVLADYSGVIGTSTTNMTIAPTVTRMEFDKEPREMIEFDEAIFSVIGFFNNDISDDISESDEIGWKTSDTSKGVFEPSKAGGTLTSKNPTEVLVPLVITVSHLTADDITTDINILEKQLEYVRVEPNLEDDLKLEWNEVLQFSLTGHYDNNQEEVLSNDDIVWSVSNTVVAKINTDSGLLTALQPIAEDATTDVIAEYRISDSDTTSDSVTITVSNVSGALLEIHAVPNSMSLIEGVKTSVTIKGYYSNQSQQNITPSSVNYLPTEPELLDVSSDNNTFFLTAKNVIGNDTNPITLTFDVEGKTAELVVEKIYDTQITGIAITKDQDEVIEGAEIQLGIVKTLTGYDQDLAVNASNVEWSCLSIAGVSCVSSVSSSGLFTAPSIDTTMDTFVVTATATSDKFSYQLQDISADTTITVYNTPTVQFEGSRIDVSEDTGKVTITVQSSQVAKHDIIIPFTIGGTATSLTDYNLPEGPLQFVIPTGDSSADLEIIIENDNSVEADETIKLNIDPSNLVNASIGSQQTYEVTIQDDDTASVYFGSPAQTKGEDTGTVTVAVKLDARHFEDVTVSYVIDSSPDCGVSRRAIAGIDYDTTGLTGSLTIPAGSLSAPIQFTITQDNYHETDECLVLKLDKTDKPNVGISTTQQEHKVTIQDADPLAFLSPPVTWIYNTGTYTYKAKVTPFDASNDHWVYKVYNNPDWSDSTTDMSEQTLTLSGKTSKFDVGQQEKNTVICISDSDTGDDFSSVPGAVDSCQFFKINVKTCRLKNGVSGGNINTPGDFEDLNCGNPANHVTIGGIGSNETLLMTSDPHFAGILIIGSDSTFHMADSSSDSSADIKLDGGTLESTGSNTIAGPIQSISGGTIKLNSDSRLDYNYTNGLLIGENLLTLDFTGSDATFDNDQAIKLDSANSRLAIQSEHLSNQIGAITISASQNGTDGSLDVSGDITVNTFSLSNNSYLRIDPGKTLRVHTATMLEEDHTLKIDSGGTLEFENGFTHGSTGYLTIQGQSILSPRSTFTLSGPLSVESESTLDLQSTNLVLSADLDTSLGTLLTDIDTTTLTLGSSDSEGTVTTRDTININSIDFAESKLNLGAGTPGLDISTDVTIDHVNERLSAGNATITFRKGLNLSNGQFTNIDGTTDIYGGSVTSGTFDVSGSAVRVLDNLSIATSGLSQSSNTRWQIKPDKQLTWNVASGGDFDGAVQIDASADFLVNKLPSSTSIKGNIALAGGSFTLKDSATITGAIALIDSSIIDIAATKTLNYKSSSPILVGEHSLNIRGGGHFNNNSASPIKLDNENGLLLLGNGTVNTGILEYLKIATASGPGKLTLQSDFAFGYLDASSDISATLGTNTLTVDDFYLANERGFTYSGSGTLRLTGNPSLFGDLITKGGAKLDLTGASTIKMSGILNTSDDSGTLSTSDSSNDIALQGDTTIHTTDGNNLTVKSIAFNGYKLTNNSTINVNSTKQLILTGTGGTLTSGKLDAITNSTVTMSDITADLIDFTFNQSRLNIIGNCSFLNGSADFAYSTIDVSGDFILSPTSLTSDSATWKINDNSRLSWNGVGTLAGFLKLNTGSQLTVNFDNATISAAITVNGEATINYPVNTLNYTGAAINLDKTLTLEGGAFNNTNAIVVGNGGNLIFDTRSGSVQKVSLNSDQTADNNLTTNIDYNIKNLDISNDNRIFIAESQTLTIQEKLIIPSLQQLVIAGKGKLVLLGGLELLSGAKFNIEDSATLQVDGEIKTASDASMTLGSGTLDLTNTSLKLYSNWTIDSTHLITDPSTDINTGLYELTWENNNNAPFQGTITIGDGTADNEGKFIITGADDADVSADIHLNGGTLKILVTTTISGDIYHDASSTIFVEDNKFLNYTGNIIKTDPNILGLTLTLKGNGNIVNTEAISLDSAVSRLKIVDADGTLSNLSADASGDIQLQGSATYTIATLTLIESLTVDTSPDARLTISDPVSILAGKEFSVIGNGTIVMNNLTIQDNSSFNQAVNVSSIISGMILNGSLNTENSTLTLQGDVSGDGTFKVKNTAIDILTNSTLGLAATDSLLLSDASTDWNISGSTFTWNGLGGNLLGNVDVSSDSIFLLTENPSTIEASINLEGKIITDVTTDLIGTVTLGPAASFDTSSDGRLIVREALSVPDSSTLTMAGNGVVDLQKALTIDSLGEVIANSTYLEAYEDITINGTLKLNQTDLRVDGSADLLAGGGVLNLVESNIFVSHDATVDILNISVDANSDWGIENQSTLRWVRPAILDGRLVTIGQNGTLEIGFENLRIAANVQFMENSTLVTDVTGDVSGDFIIDSSADIKVNGATLTYTGSVFGLKSHTLSLSGNGIIANEKEGDPKWLVLDETGSKLVLSGLNGQISNVKVDGSTTGNLIQVDKSYTINHLELDSNTTIEIAEDMTLTIDAPLVIPSAVTLNLTGSGRLLLNNDLTVTGNVVVADGGIIQVAGDLTVNDGATVNAGMGILDIGGEITIAESGTVKIGEGSLTLPATGSSVSGAGTLDLKNTTYTLSGDLILSATLSTDSSTDIITGSHILEWQRNGSDVLHGKIRIDTDGYFNITTNEADISADIYLRGGTLEIDVTTDLSGNIYHEASSTIDILENVSLNYTGEDVSIDALTLTLAGDGKMINTSTLRLNDEVSRLLFSANGQLERATADGTTDTSLAIQGAYTINDLILNYPLTVDMSQDASLMITNALNVLKPASLSVLGNNNTSLNISRMSSDSTVDVSSLTSLTISGDLDVSSDGFLKASTTKVTFGGSTDLQLSGNGKYNFSSSQVYLNTNLTLNLEPPAEISDDLSHWYTNDNTMTWNGIGGNLSGTIDVSADGELQITSNQAIIDAQLNLNGKLAVDVTTDLAGAVTLGAAPTIDISDDARLTVHEGLSIPGSSELTVSGNGIIDLQQNPVIDGTLSLVRTSLAIGGSLDTLSGNGTLELENSQIVATQDVTVDVSDISADTSSDWSIENGSTITWKTLEALKGRQVTIGNDGELKIVEGSISANIALMNSSLLNIDTTIAVSGDLVFDDSDITADIDVADGFMMNYTGADVHLAGNSLVLSGSGTINNNNGGGGWFLLDETGSKLVLSGVNGQISNVKVEALDDSSLIQANESYAIDQLVIASNTTIEIAAGERLTIDATLDVQENATLTLSGPGELYVKDGFTVAGTVSINSGTLSVQNDITLESSGSVKVEGGKLEQVDGTPLSIVGGFLDLSAQTVTLTSNLTLSTELITDPSTDIKTGLYELTWKNNDTIDFQGKIYIGNKSAGNSGKFTITDGTKADISADIYLWGGTLEIDVTTDLSGNIYHEASSTIDILENVSLNYTGEDVSVDAFTLTLAGDGKMVNTSTIRLNDEVSRLLFSANGQLQRATADGTTDTSLAIQGTYTINDLILNYPLTVDMSADANLTITNPLIVPPSAAFMTSGSGNLSLSRLSMDSTVDVSSLTSFTISGDLDVSSDGFLDTGGSFEVDRTYLTFNNASGNTISGDGAVNLTYTTVNVASNLLLNLTSSDGLTTNTGTKWNVNGQTLTWNGLGGDLNGTIDLSSDAVLAITDNSADVAANINLYEGHLNIDATTDIKGVVTFNTGYDASVDIAAGTTLTLEQTEVTVASNTLGITGPGNLVLKKLIVDSTVDVTDTSVTFKDDLVVNQSLDITNSSITFDGSANAISGTGTIGLNNVSINLNNDLTITPVLNSDISTDWNLGGNKLTWSSNSDLNGSGLVLNNGILEINNSISIKSPMNISGGLLDINQNSQLLKDFADVTADATIDVSGDSYFIVSGGELNIGDNQLELSGSGIIDNTSDVVLNDSDSVLHLTGADGLLNKAKFSASSSTDKGIVVDEDYVIQTVTLDNADGIISVADSKTLIIGDKLYVSESGGKLIKGTGNGSIILHEVILNGNLELGDGFALAPDATLYVLNDAILTVNSDLHFNDGLVVADGATLTITGGAYTVTFAGGYNLGATGKVKVSGSVTMELPYNDVVLDEWTTDTTTTDSGTTSPSRSDALDVLSFKAKSGDEQIFLSWDYQDATYDHILIRRDLGNYPDSTSDGTFVFNGTSVTYTDTSSDGIENRISYFYTAFAHDGSGDYAPGVHAMAAATKVPDGLISYYMLGAEDCTNDVLLDSCGMGNHGLCQGNLDLAADVSGDATGALSFSGSPDAAEIDNPFVESVSATSDTTTGSFTIAFWINTLQTGGDASSDWFADSNIPIIDGKIGVDQNDFGIALGAGRVIFGLEYNGNAYNISSAVINNGTWHHVAVTRDYGSGNMEINIDGTSDALGGGPVDADLNSPSFLGLGRSPFGSTYFEGDLDEIRFYKRVLTPEDILTLFNN